MANPRFKLVAGGVAGQVGWAAGPQDCLSGVQALKHPGHHRAPDVQFAARLPPVPLQVFPARSGPHCQGRVSPQAQGPGREQGESGPVLTGQLREGKFESKG